MSGYGSFDYGLISGCFSSWIFLSSIAIGFASTIYLGSLNDSTLNSSFSLIGLSFRHCSGTILKTCFLDESVTDWQGLLCFFEDGSVVFFSGLGGSRFGTFLSNGLQSWAESFSTLSFSDLRGLDFMMLTGSWNSEGPLAYFWGSDTFLSLRWFFWRSVKISKFSSSRWIFFRARFWLTSFSYFRIGLLRLSIFWSTTCIMVVWHLVSICIFLTAFLLIWEPLWTWGGLRPWTILSVF